MSLYDALNVNPNADYDEIKRAYKARAQEHHPDKGGSEKIFIEIKLAYEVLSDPTRREAYDRTGTVTQERSREAVAQERLAAIIQQIINRADFDGDIVKKIESVLTAIEQNIKADMFKQANHLGVLKRETGRVTHKHDELPDMFNHMLNEAIEQCEKAIANSENELVIVEDARELLAHYQDKGKVLMSQWITTSAV